MRLRNGERFPTITASATLEARRRDDPCEIAIASSEMVELCLPADPENAERQKTH